MEKIPDSAWKEILNLIPQKKCKVGRPEMDPKKVINGIFEKIMKCAANIYADNEANRGYWLAVDTSHSKAPLANWSGKNPTDRGKRGVKKVIIVDHRGAPLAVTVAPSNVHDSKLLEPAIEALADKRHDQQKVLAADSAFDARKLRRCCRERGFLLIAATNMRRRKNVCRNRVKRRWLVERTFGWLSWYRGLKICWSKTAESFLAMLQFAASLQLFRMA